MTIADFNFKEEWVLYCEKTCHRQEISCKRDRGYFFPFPAPKGWPRHFSRCKSEKHYKEREKWRGHPLVYFSFTRQVNSIFFLQSETSTFVNGPKRGHFFISSQRVWRRSWRIIAKIMIFIALFIMRPLLTLATLPSLFSLMWQYGIMMVHVWLALYFPTRQTQGMTLNV